ncbi:tyrosine-type recombinase/integrase [Pseudomonas putida]|nr:site-specific integrase [Pseudomonas putida]
MPPTEKNDDFAFNATRFLSAFHPANVESNLSTLHSFKGRSNETIAFSDSEIVAMWVETSSSNKGTKRAKRKEGERLVFYCAFILSKRLNKLTNNDIEQYISFTGAPEPEDNWVSKTKWPRHDSRWRPFAGPLGANSKRLTILVLSNLFKWMRTMSFITENPINEATNLNLPAPPLEVRLLADGAIYFIYKAVGSDSNQRKRVRNSFMITLFYTTAITPFEAETSNMHAINQKTGQITISRSGKTTRVIPISQMFLDELAVYRTTFNLPEKIQKDEDTPLLVTANSKYKRLSCSAMTNCISAIMKNAAALAQLEGAHHLAGLLKQASAYWLRHTHLRNLAEDGSEFLTINRIAGHSSLGTTKKYFDIDR